MALPFLPAHDATVAFYGLKAKAGTESIQQLVCYIEQTWIKSVTWSPESWSVFMLPIRTNNDIEGYHNAINRRVGGRCSLPFYQLINLLYSETDLVNLQVRLVSDGKLTRVQRTKYVKLQKKVFELWDEYNSGTKTAKKLLKACSHLNGPISS